MKQLLWVFLCLLCGPAWAAIALFRLDQQPNQERFSLSELSDPITKSLRAAPTEWVTYSLGFGLMVDGVKYYIKPAMFMTQSWPGEVCTPVGKALVYRCEEGQRFAEGCHLLFFNEAREWVGMYSIKIKEKEYPSFCNAIPAMGLANKANNELLITMQYFLLNGGGAKKASEIGANWIRMTSLFRIKAVNGKIEVEQDDSCLGNPNRIETIGQARQALKIAGCD